MLKAKYDISNFGLEVAGDIWNMNFSLLDQGREVASIHQEWFKIASTYHVDIYDDSLADLVISLVIAIDYVKAINHQVALPQADYRLESNGLEIDRFRLTTRNQNLLEIKC